jgi:hypothetical protein
MRNAELVVRMMIVRNLRGCMYNFALNQFMGESE